MYINILFYILNYLDYKYLLKFALLNKECYDVFIYKLKNNIIFTIFDIKEAIILNKKGYKINLDLSYDTNIKNIKKLSKYKPNLYKLNLSYSIYPKNMCLSIKNIENLTLIHTKNISIFDNENSKLKSINICSNGNKCLNDKKYYDFFQKKNSNVKIKFINNLKIKRI
jgi:hypothetical protein